MSQDAVERFLGRLLTDDDFRKDAGRSFDRVCFKWGFDLSGEEKQILNELDFGEFELLAEGLHRGIRRSPRIRKPTARTRAGKKSP